MENSLRPSKWYLLSQSAVAFFGQGDTCSADPDSGPRSTYLVNPSHSPDLVRVTCVYGKLSRFVSGRRRPGPFCRDADFGQKGSEATPALHSCESNQYALAAHLTTTQWSRMCAGARRTE